MSNLVVLCSGGFDSICLLNLVRDVNKEDKIYTLFFDYGQPSYDNEKACTIKACKKLRCEFVELKLPKFEWTKFGFYTKEFREDESKHYLESRNLVFFSYAISFAESVNAPYIFAALIKTDYLDSSSWFISTLNLISNKLGTEIKCPFIELEKYKLSMFAFKYKIKEEDFNSCDCLIDNKPCGICKDCLSIKNVYECIEDNFEFLKRMNE